MDNDMMTFIGTDAKGEEIIFEILFSFEDSDTGKIYIVYTDNSIDEEGRTRIYASMYEPNEERHNLIPIETDEEWETINSILDKLRMRFSTASDELD